MKRYGLPAPEFYEERDRFKVIFRNSNVAINEQSRQQKRSIEEYQDMILDYCKEAKTAKEIREYLNIRSRQYISTNIIKPLIRSGKLDYTNKNSIKARNQKYVTIKKDEIY